MEADINIKGLKVINVDTVREIRLLYGNYKAEEMLKAYYDDLKKNKRQLLKEINRRDYKIKKHFKICTIKGCKVEAVKNHVNCIHHSKKKNIISYNYYHSNL